MIGLGKVDIALNDVRKELSAISHRIGSINQVVSDLRREVGRYMGIFNHAREGLLLMDPNRIITDVNDTLIHMLEFDRSDLIGRRPEAFYDRTSVDVFSASPSHLSYEVLFATRSGRKLPMLFSRSTLRDDDGVANGYAAFLIDLSELKETREELRKSEERYRELSIRDSLTGLFNTRHLYEALDELTYRSRRDGSRFSLVFMDMDNFKHVVDTYGHLNGSRALQEVAETLLDCLESPSFGVAYGGDEFVLVLPGMGKKQAREMARQIRTRMRKRAYLAAAGHHVQLSASFGVATCPDDGDDRTVLLALADQAMFRVKAGGKNGIALSK